MYPPLRLYPSVGGPVYGSGVVTFVMLAKKSVPLTDIVSFASSSCLCSVESGGGCSHGANVVVRCLRVVVGGGYFVENLKYQSLKFLTVYISKKAHNS